MESDGETVCHVCGSNPCYGICPMADPYCGDPQREHDDHEAGAQYDDMSERYAGEGVEYMDELDKDTCGECGELPHRCRCATEHP